MSKSIKTLLAVGMVAFVAACASQPEEVVYVEEPVMSEHVSNGKYK